MVFCVMCSCLSLLILPHGSICLLPMFGIICPYPAVWVRFPGFPPGLVCSSLIVQVKGFWGFQHNLAAAQVLYIFAVHFLLIMGCFWVTPPVSLIMQLLNCCVHWLFQKECAHWLVVGSGMVLGPIVSIVCFPWLPVKSELLLLLAITQLIEVYVHCFCCSWDYFVCCDAIGHGVISLDWHWWLWVA